MTETQIKLVIGSLLHDIGRIIHKPEDGYDQGMSACRFLKECRLDIDGDILDCVRYHRIGQFKQAAAADDALAYITYFAEEIAAAINRHEKTDSDEEFDKSMPLASVFNILNGNSQKLHYRQQTIDAGAGINYPTDEAVHGWKQFYDSIIRSIGRNIELRFELTHEYINLLLARLEADLSYVPASTVRREQSDISLFDHMKVTAAAAECIYAYLKDKGTGNYREALLEDKSGSIWQQKMFMLYSIDISGIQKFIYTISSEGALKGLRSRSFYLEILMEHLVDELLDKLELSRCCQIYVGGGHCYMLLPNTSRVRELLENNEREVNEWFIEHFDIELYAAGGYAECSADNLRNVPEGSYTELYRQVSANVSRKKSSRYTEAEIMRLNSTHSKGERECRICRRRERLDNNGWCPVCASIENLSRKILYEDYFIVLKKSSDDMLPLPGGYSLTAGGEQELRAFMDSDDYVRSYAKNKPYSGRHVTTRLWAGNYGISNASFRDYAEDSGMRIREPGSDTETAYGIRRIAVMRADVDNLGNTFVNGFKPAGSIGSGSSQKQQASGRVEAVPGQKRKGSDLRYYENLTRTAVLSRQLSLFFKYHINGILEEGIRQDISSGGRRRLSIVYSGGDDIFLAGAWNDVIDAFSDIREAFERFTQHTLTISGGVGIYNDSYPINRMAEETADLEDYSKGIQGKDAVTLFDETGRYKWDIFLSKVIDEKYQSIRRYMDKTDMRGKVFLYRLLTLLRGDDGRFNRARYVYYLSRLEPDRRDDNYEEEKEAYREFSGKMYIWSEDEEDRRQLVTAIYLYVYLTREREGR